MAKIDDSVKKKVPELRFKGFTDEWEERKLKDVTERVRSNDGRMDLPTLTMSASSGWLDQKDRFSGDISGKEKKNYTLLKKGELSYNHGNSKLAKYGVVFSLINYEEALVPRVYHSFKALENTSADFIEYMFSTKLPDRELGKLISSGARMDGLLNINYDDFMNIHISIPNYEEQILMSAFFRKLDENIALHQRKLDLLKEQKKGFLQKMFPKNGAKVPELRFAGFADDWEERKLGDAVSISSGVTGDATLQDGKYRLTRIESISQGMLNVARLGFTNEKPDQKYLLNFGDILYSNINSLSHIGKVALVDTTGIYHGINLLRLKMRNGVDSEFLFQRLNTMPMKNWAVSHANPAVSQASINQTELSKQPISSPTLPEQQQIGSFFKEIDNTIALHQRKLDLLKEQKKGFLQKMFV